jgi:flagellar hook-basal body complex protein FliE
MSIPLIGAVQNITAASTSPATQGVQPTDGSNFAASLGGAIENLQYLQTSSDNLAVKAVTGNLDDIHDATIAATRAQVTLELVAAVRNKGVDAFNEIMRMQG